MVQMAEDEKSKIDHPLKLQKRVPLLYFISVGAPSLAIKHDNNLTILHSYTKLFIQ